MMGWDWMDGAGGWGMGFGLLMWLVPLAIIGLVAWLALRGVPRASERSQESAEDVLRRRFASGEIDAEEYERRLSVLRRSP